MVERVFSADDDCVDGAKYVRSSSSARAPPTEMVERTRKNTIFSFHLKKKKVRHDFLIILIVRLRRFLWRYFNDKCPERIIVMRERNKCLRSQDSLHTHTKQMRSLSLSRSDIRPTCVCSNLILSPGFNVARSATLSVGNGHPPAET